jgi:hypothetical protein
MRAMQTLILPLLISVLFSTISWAGTPHKTAASLYPKLAQIQDFEVHDIELQDFAVGRENIPHETIEYARTALQNESHLQYKSPAQGILNFHCENTGCSKIRAEVTQGVGGPVIWQFRQQYRVCPLLDFGLVPDSKKFAAKIVKQLAKDYQQAIQSTDNRIQITEE